MSTLVVINSGIWRQYRRFHADPQLGGAVVLPDGPIVLIGNTSELLLPQQAPTIIKPTREYWGKFQDRCWRKDFALERLTNKWVAADKLPEPGLYARHFAASGMVGLICHYEDRSWSDELWFTSREWTEFVQIVSTNQACMGRG